MSIKFISESLDGRNVTMEITRDQVLPELLEDFKHFLLGVGYVFNPIADLVLEDAIPLDVEALYSSQELDQARETIQRLEDQIDDLEAAVDHAELALGIKMVETAGHESRVEALTARVSKLTDEVHMQQDLIYELQDELNLLRQRDEDKYDWSN